MHGLSATCTEFVEYIGPDADGPANSDDGDAAGADHVAKRAFGYHVVQVTHGFWNPQEFGANLFALHFWLPLVTSAHSFSLDRTAVQSL
jgi:hypothetical protein